MLVLSRRRSPCGLSMGYDRPREDLHRLGQPRSRRIPRARRKRRGSRRCAGRRPLRRPDRRPHAAARVARVATVKGGSAWLVNPGTVAGLSAPATWVLGDLDAMRYEVFKLSMAA